MYSKKSKSKLYPVLNIFLKTQILNVSAFLLIFILISILIYNADDLSLKYYFYIISAVTAISNFVSGFYCAVKLKKNGMINALLFCLPLNIIILLISIIVNSFKIDLTILFSTIIFLASSMLGGILSVNINIKNKRKRVGR